MAPRNVLMYFVQHYLASWQTVLNAHGLKTNYFLCKTNSGFLHLHPIKNKGTLIGIDRGLSFFFKIQEAK